MQSPRVFYLQWDHMHPYQCYVDYSLEQSVTHDTTIDWINEGGGGEIPGVHDVTFIGAHCEANIQSPR